MEQLRYCRKIIGIVAIECILNDNVLLHQFNEQKRNTVNKADNVGSSAIKFTVNLQFLHRQEMIFLGLFEIKYGSVAGFKSAVGLLNLKRDTVTEHRIFFLIDLHERSRCRIGAKSLDG